MLCLKWAENTGGICRSNIILYLKAVLKLMLDTVFALEIVIQTFDNGIKNLL